MSDPCAIKTTCPYCGVGCGVLAVREGAREISVRGDPDHPANFGRLCSKGSALGEVVGLEGRLLYPEINGARATWDEALSTVASRFKAVIDEHGPEAVAFYVSGQLLTEDYYVANKLMKGFIGSANIDSNSRLCMSSSVAGHKRAFGSDTVPGTYEDLEQADLIVLVGSNLAWCHPVLFQRIEAAKQARPSLRVVLIDPRKTMSADMADLHLPIKSDGDTALFSGLLSWLATHGALDTAYIKDHTQGFSDALATAEEISLSDVSQKTGLSLDQLNEFYDLFLKTEKTVTVYSQGVNQSTGGTDKVNAIINCHLATGRIGRAGMGPFSVTGQPNAMGGREVGALAHMLACHTDIENPDHRHMVGRFWKTQILAKAPGLKAVDLFKAVKDGQIKALWIMATNPVVSLPDGGDVEAALKACPFVVVSDANGQTDTMRHAHVKLPAAVWGEKSGTVTNSERRISRQRSFLPAPGEARPDWWIVSQVAQHMGFDDAFSYEKPADIFSEYAALSGFENNGVRDFDIGVYGGLSHKDYETLEPFQWPHRAGKDISNKRFFAQGGFYTKDKRARFVCVKPVQDQDADKKFPLMLNTGRVRDHWHTMAQTGKSQRLSAHYAEPFVEIHPEDAKQCGLRDADIVRLSSAQGNILVRALITNRQAQGAVFVPMHWSDQFSSNGRANTITRACPDPISGQPGFKAGQVRAERFDASAYAFAVMRVKPNEIDADYWALAKCAEGWRLELAYGRDIINWESEMRSLCGLGTEVDMLSYHDSRTGQHRMAVFHNGNLIAAMFVACEAVAASRVWAAQQLSEAHEDIRSRLSVVAGRPAADQPDPGAIVCSCFSVGVNQIIAAVTQGGAMSIDDVGAALNAGTNCGSCRSEIKGIIDVHRLVAAE